MNICLLLFKLAIDGFVFSANTVAGFLSQEDTNAQNKQLAQENTAFQERMSNTAYQRQVKDMQAAGLNPMLSYLKGGGASTPGGSVAQIQNPYTAGVASGESAARSFLTSKQVPKLEAETKNIGSQTENVDADTIKKRADTLYTLALKDVAGATADEKRSHINVLEAQAKEISERIKNIPLEGKRLIEAAKSLEATSELTGYQRLTEKERTKQMTALTIKTLIEGNLLKLDQAAIDDAGNFGKEFGQFKPIIDSIISIVRMLKR